MLRLFCKYLSWSILTALAFQAGIASEGQSGQELYQAHCAGCHEGGVAKAPHLVMLQAMSPESILESMMSGAMQVQARELKKSQKTRVAEFIAGREIKSEREKVTNYCGNGISQAAAAGNITDWGMDKKNSRYIPSDISKLNKSNVPDLELKWAFAYPNATRARSQPTVADGVIYVGSQDGTVYALDLEKGCTFWKYKAKAEVRSAVTVSTESNEDTPLVYFGDFNGNVYALNGHTGEEYWVNNLQDHKDVTITGSPKLAGDTLYVPMSSREWATAADPFYDCCTFRGGVAAFDSSTGDMKWKNHVIQDEPARTGKVNPRGAEIIAPSGAPVWNSPTIDKKRNLLYVGTGQAYSSPAPGSSNAVVAFDLDSGEVRWVHQALEDDAWNMSCNIGHDDNCPEQDGPDLDIGASPILYTMQNGKDIILVGQKSGDVFALDPDNKGELIWKNKVGRGGFIGGIHWGMAVQPETDMLFAPNADTDIGDRFKGERRPGMIALNIPDGREVWRNDADMECVENAPPQCDPGLSAAATATDGVVFAGALDGYLRAYDASSGEIIWQYDTAREFDSISGVSGYGGSIESDGPVMIDGNVLINSGYLWGGRMPGNVLLKFGIKERDSSNSKPE